jgi:hypothetical protein
VKHYAITALVALATIAVVFRVSAIRSVVAGQ